jgi:flagellar basal body-associated protein FliL
VILPSGATEKAKSSKSLFNSFNRIYKFSMIGGAAIAAWFSSQFLQIQQTSLPTESMRGTDMMMEQAEEAAQKSLEAPPVAESMPFAAQDVQTGEPATDIYISIIVTLGVVVLGLIIERILRARRK